MWEILEKKGLSRKIRKFPKEILRNYEIWKRIVELEGPIGLKQIKGFHDETRKGKWQGFRSSRLNLKWKIIYKVKQDAVEIYVIDINPHEY